MKVILVPLDDRPCNYYFPKILPNTKYDLVVTPKHIMGNIKRCAKINALKLWLKENAINSDYLVIALDTLIYGGLIPSRLHGKTLEELIFNLDFLKEIKEINRNLKIYAFITIMRTPNTNFNSEEPLYYSKYGKNIFRYGILNNKKEINIITELENEELNSLQKLIPSKVLSDYINRRKINLEVTKHANDLYKEGLFSYFYIPQDDSSPYGFTRLDQIRLKDYVSTNKKVNVFPGADEVGMVMLGRALNDYYKVKPKVYVYYTSVKGEFVVPSFEDRMIDITINMQIISLGGIRVYSLKECDLVLAINIGSAMLYFPKDEERIIPYDIDRNLSELISFIKYAKSLGKLVGIGDVAVPTGADLELIGLLKKEKMLLDIDGYASWNTASNTIGTVLSELAHLFISHDKKKNYKFLIHRYYDDVAYCSSVRTWTDINAALARGLTEAKLDGKKGVATQMARQELTCYMNQNYPEISRYVKDIIVSSPWNRTFEMQFTIKYKRF